MVTGFSFYKSYHDSLKDLSNDDRKEMLIAIVDFVFDDIEPQFDGFKKTIWTLIKPNLETSKNKSNNAKKSNQNQNEIKLKSNQNQNEIKLKSNQNQNEINDLYDKDKDKDKDKEYNKEYFNNKKINEIFIEFLKVRKKLKAVNSERAINNLINVLNQYDEPTQLKMIDKSITNSWKDVYKLKDDEKPKESRRIL